MSKVSTLLEYASNAVKHKHATNMHSHRVLIWARHSVNYAKVRARVLCPSTIGVSATHPNPPNPHHLHLCRWMTSTISISWTERQRERERHEGRCLLGGPRKRERWRPSAPSAPSAPLFSILFLREIVLILHLSFFILFFFKSGADGAGAGGGGRRWCSRDIGFIEKACVPTTTHDAGPCLIQGRPPRSPMGSYRLGNRDGYRLHRKGSYLTDSTSARTCTSRLYALTENKAHITNVPFPCISNRHIRNFQKYKHVARSKSF